MNWAGYKDIDLNETTLKGYVAGTSYPITNKTIGGRLSFGLYDKGYAEKAASLFRDGEVAYAAAPRDVVATGIGLPWIQTGNFSLGIGNTNTTSNKWWSGIPLLDLLSDHTKAYYHDEEVTRFLTKNKYEFDSIRNYQQKIWESKELKIKPIPLNGAMSDSKGE